MIRAAYTGDDGQRVAVIGLSSDDLQQLKEGGGFRFKLAELGLAGEAVIMWGATDQAILAELARLGVRLPM